MHQHIHTDIARSRSWRPPARAWRARRRISLQAAHRWRRADNSYSGEVEQISEHDDDVHLSGDSQLPPEMAAIAVRAAIARHLEPIWSSCSNVSS